MKKSLEDFVKVGWTDEARAASLEARRRGWKGPTGETGDVTLHHPDMPGHTLGVRPTGAWMHYSNLTGHGQAPRLLASGGAPGIQEYLNGVHGKPASKAEAVEKIDWIEKADDLEDVCFAYVAPGGTLDAHKRTVPRELRRYPVMRSADVVDQRALNTAVTAITASELPPGTKARVLRRLGAIGDRVTKAWTDAAREASRAARQHGWKHSYTMGGEDGAGPAVYTHPDAPGHAVSVDSAGTWAHHDVTPQGLRSQVGQGGTPRELTSHLRTFHGSTTVKITGAPGSIGSVASVGATAIKPNQDLSVPSGLVMSKGETTVPGDVKKYITHAGGTWTVHAENGRVLGTHDSKADATAQLRAVEANKHGHGYSKSTREAFEKIGFRVEGSVDIEKAVVYEPFGVDRLVHVVKAEEQRYTLSVVYPCSARGMPEPDFHGDTMSDIELERAAWGFMGRGTDRIGLMHRPGSQGAGRVVESYIWRGESWKMQDAGGAEQEISPGDWVMGIVWTPEAWAAIRGGEITGLSLQGRASKHAMIEE